MDPYGSAATRRPADRRVVPSGRLWLIAAAVGVGLGAFSQLADGIIGGRLIGILGNMAAPWGLAAFLVGRRTTVPWRGAAAGGVALVVGVVVYYLGAELRGYNPAQLDVLWTMVAVVAGPVMGWCGSAISARPERPPVLAVALPSAMLVAEAVFQAIDRRIWHANLAAETYRLIDIGVMLTLLVGGLSLPLIFEKDGHRRGVIYAAVALASLVGVVGLLAVRRAISGWSAL